MYWKAVIVKFDGDKKSVGISLFRSMSPEEKPILYIFGLLDERGVKNKWRRPMKIKRWLLYDPHSYSSCRRYLKKNDDFKITEIGERTELGLFDKDIIIKKFPTMTKEVNMRSGKKKK